jgi:hypothetical protein
MKEKKGDKDADCFLEVIDNNLSLWDSSPFFSMSLRFIQRQLEMCPLQTVIKISLYNRRPSNSNNASVVAKCRLLEAKHDDFIINISSTFSMFF